MIPFSKLQDFALLCQRLILATIFLFAGYMKLSMWSASAADFGMSEAMLNLMKFLSIVEPIGAVALIAGFLTRWAALGLAIIMVGAIWIMKDVYAFFTMPQAPGLDSNALILAGCIVLMAFGAGKWAVDYHWRRMSAS